MIEAKIKERQGTATSDELSFLKNGGEFVTMDTAEKSMSRASTLIQSKDTITGYVYLITKCGRNVIGYTMNELTDREISDVTAYYTQAYPAATLLSSATRSYNCHSYAWNMSDGGTTCWIDPYTTSGAANVSLYFTHDYYMTTTASGGTKVIYGALDHSAIKSSVSGMYESKWVRGPLMRHKLTDCPYNSPDISYYKECRYAGTLSTSYGTGSTQIGVHGSYYVSSTDLNSSNYPTGSNVTEEWILETAKGDELDSTIADFSISGHTVIATFKMAGMYSFTYCRKLNGTTLCSFGFDPIVEP